MPDRFRNDTGQVLISMEFGVIGPNEYAPAEYDPKEHGVLPGFTRVEEDPPAGPPDDKPEDPPGDEADAAGAPDAAGDSTTASDGQPARTRGKGAKDKEAGE